MLILCAWRGLLLIRCWQNRLLQQIRQQQVELQRLHAAQGQNQTTVAAEDPAPSSDRSSHVTTPQPMAPPPRSPGVPYPRTSFDIARENLQRRSRTPSRGATSPGFRRPSFGGIDSGESTSLAGRDESAFYQAETQSLVRENQMLRHRIRELGNFFRQDPCRCKF